MDSFPIICVAVNFNFMRINRHAYISVGCQGDHFGFSYSGNVSISAAGRKCLPWNESSIINITYPNFSDHSLRNEMAVLERLRKANLDRASK